MPDDPISVFVSYSHDSPQHEARVLALADRLCADGIAAMIDQYQTAPPEGWQLWMEKQIRDAKFVLLVCTETYCRRVMKEDDGKGLGVMWESAIIYSHLYSAGVVNEKFIPIVFDRADTKHIPTPLQPTTYYCVGDDAGYDSLYRRLTNQPAIPIPTIGKRRVLSPLPRPTTSAQPPSPTTFQPNLVHPYPLQSNFTGRVEERAELTAWLADDAHPICELVAMGGMGKSALTWVWVTHDILKAESGKQKAESSGRAETENLKSEILNLKFVMWWSFYESESSFAKFVDEALKYVSGHDIDAAKFPTTYERAHELRRELQDKRVLFVLDGFERQLRAYARLDAAYQRDDASDPSREARACVEPNAARWLQDLAAGTTRAKLLITTRLPVSDLQDRAGDALAGVRQRELKSLARDDAVAFMRAQGVTQGTHAEIANGCDAYGNHPLSLRLLSGLIARDPRTPGDIASAPRHDVHADLVQRQHHVLEQSYNVLPDKERALLSRLAAFRSPMDYAALAIFNEFGNEAKFDAALNDLKARGLLQRDKDSNRYDLHPIVRRYCYDRLNDKTGVHTRLRDYFATIPTPDADKVQSVADLASVIELYHHTVNAGRYDEAVVLFRDRLNQLLYYRFGAYQLQIELLRALFPDGIDRPPRLKREDAQAWMLNELANLYSLSGQPRNAVRAFEQVNDIYANRMKNKQYLAIGLGNIASMAQIQLGELAAAERNLRRRIELCREIKDEFNEAIGRTELGRLLAYRGAFDEAAGELDAAIGFKQWRTNQQGVGVNWAYRALRALLMGDAKSAFAAAQQAHRIATSRQNERDIIRAEWLLGAAQTDLTGLQDLSGLNQAHTHLTEALQRCRRIGMVDHEPDILLAWARWHYAHRAPSSAPLGGSAQDDKDAQSYAEEALSIADRCEFRLAQAEIHNFMAQMAVDRADEGRKTDDGKSVAEALAEAKHHAEIAKERAECDGAPHCYKPALDEAEKMLASL